MRRSERCCVTACRAGCTWGCCIPASGWRARAKPRAALLAERPVYFVGVDPRWESKAREIWGDEPGAAANLRHLTLGRDHLDDIPPQAAVMLMPAARRQLSGHPVLARALPARGFSRDSARQILAFVVQANIAAWLGQ